MTHIELCVIWHHWINLEDRLNKIDSKIILMFETVIKIWNTCKRQFSLKENIEEQEWTKE